MTPAEHHLGDRLAALVDGELGHDARERVLAHLATCAGCKAEADEQRRLKDVFAGTAPPPPSAGLLARLQGLPAGGDLLPGGSEDGDGPGSPGDGPGSSAGPAEPALLETSGIRTPDGAPWAFGPPAGGGFPTGGRGRSPLTPQRGFRIHEPARAERAERSASRGRRFAFAAAGAFSLAALALGGTLASGAGTSTVAQGDGSGASAGPVRSASSNGGGSSRDTRRRGTDETRGSAGEDDGALRSLSASALAAGAVRGISRPGSRYGVETVTPSLLSLVDAPPRGPLQRPVDASLTTALGRGPAPQGLTLSSSPPGLAAAPSLTGGHSLLTPRPYRAPSALSTQDPAPPRARQDPAPLSSAAAVSASGSPRFPGSPAGG